MPDSDTDIAVGFAALKEQYADPRPPAAAVFDAVHRRRRRIQSMAVAAVGAAVAAVAVVIPIIAAAGGGTARPTAKPTPTASTTVYGLHTLLTLPQGPVTRTISVDGGSLRIEPEPAGYSPRVSATLANQVVSRIRDGGSSSLGPAYGRVTIARSLTRSLPAYQSRSAWITVIQVSPFAGSCPPLKRIAPRGTPNSVTVILTDSNTGRASIVYRSAGVGFCGIYLRRPEVNIAQETISLRWTLLGQRPDPGQAGSVDWHISYRVPSCALTDTGPGLTSTNTGQTMLYVETEMPIDRPAHCPTSTHATWFGPERQSASAVRHALTGRQDY